MTQEYYFGREWKDRRARALARASQSALDAARAGAREAVVGAWQDMETARALVQASRDQSSATASALDSARNEVRVGQKPAVDLLDAEREDLAARWSPPGGPV